jgi:acetyl esterase/lipase
MKSEGWNTAFRWSLLVSLFLSPVSPVCAQDSDPSSNKAPAQSQTPANSGTTPASPRSSDETPLPEGTIVRKDIRFGQDALQKLDVYSPKSASKLPVIIMVHGGAWYMGNKANGGVVGNKAAYFLGHGYIFVSVDYRLWPKAHIPEQVQDVALALACVQKNASAWGGDGSRVILIGHSAGAHLISMLAAVPALAFQEGARPWLATVSLDSAGFDLPALMQQPHDGFYDSVFGKKMEFRCHWSPTLRLTGKPYPILLVYSAARADAAPQNQAFAAKVKKRGGRAELLPLDMEHAQINKDLGLPGRYTEAVQIFLHSVH